MALASGERIRIPVDHPLASRIKSLPLQISGVHKHEIIDTAENRFAKFVVQSFVDFIDRSVVLIRRAPNMDRALVEWLLQADKAFKEIMSRQFFKGIGRLSVLPIGSPTLQRKHGYRQILDAWIKFNSASRVSWNALDEVLEAGQRDAALLYEYWCFFVIRDAISAAFGLEGEDLSGVLRHTADGLSLTLKTGEQAAVKGYFDFKGRRFGLRLSYQRSFVPHGSVRTSRYFHTNGRTAPRLTRHLAVSPALR
jgi:Domain of unknown function (DUF2357)/PD-(D/E)XK nuclease superfamily